MMRAISKQVERDLRIVDDHNRLPEDGNGADGTIFVFMLQPVMSLQFSPWLGQVVDISEER